MTRALTYSPFKYYFGIFAPFLFCCLIALFFRPSGTLAKEFLHIHQSFHWIKNDIIIYNLPAGLWVFSLTLISFNIQKLRLLFFLAPLSFIVILEILQYLAITDGTYDILDIIIPFSFFLISILLYSFNRNYFSLKKDKVWSQITYFSLFISVILADVN